VIREGGARSYEGVLVTRADSPVRSLKELDTKTVAFVDRYSTSGFVYPAKLLRDAGVKPVVVFAGTHHKALEELRAGRAAAAATFAGAAAADATLRVLARTEAIPNEPVSFRDGLDDPAKRRFIEALVAFAGTQEGKAVLQEMAGITGFEPATDEDYRPVHDVVRGADRTVQDLVPRGWWIHNENRRPLSAYAP
jgi:phosphonate transport system substrate-binding protein